jgi:hypothetical protein
VSVADVRCADAVGMCTVVVALTSTSVLVTVLVKVSVAVVFLASTEAGTSSATNAVAVVGKRIL